MKSGPAEKWSGNRSRRSVRDRSWLVKGLRTSASVYRMLNSKALRSVLLRSAHALLCVAHGHNGSMHRNVVLCRWRGGPRENCSERFGKNGHQIPIKGDRIADECPDRAFIISIVRPFLGRNSIGRRHRPVVMPCTEHAIPQRTTGEILVAVLDVDGVMQLMEAR